MRFGAQLWSQQTTWPRVPRRRARGRGAPAGTRSGRGTTCSRSSGRGSSRSSRAGRRSRRPRRVTEQGPARADGRREHVPQPGADREARDDPRPRQPAAGRSSASAAPGSSASTRRSGSRRGARASASGSTGSTRRSMLMRRLLDGERFEPRGPLLHARDALCEPRPVQAHLPILIGGSGPKKTLRTVAALRPTRGTPRARSTRSAAALDDPRRALRGGRPRPRRDRADGQLPDLDPRHRRGRRGGLRRAARGERRSTTRDVPTAPRAARSSSPTAIAPYRDLGFRPSSSGCPAPFDRETIERMRRGAERSPASARVAEGSGAGPRVVGLAGGVGGAKLAEGLQALLGERLTVIVNTADDTERHGLLVCADHDTVMYTLAGLENPELGWGLAGRHVGPTMTPRALRRGGLVPARRPGPRDPHRPDRAAPRAASG